MAVTSWTNPTATSDPGAGWTNDANVKTEDGTTAYVDEKVLYDNLLCYTYGFSIPSSATIDGIEVRVKSKVVPDAGTSTTVRVKLTKNLSTFSSEEAYTENSLTLVERLEGGATNKWGFTWTPSEINATNFGVAIGAYGSTGDTLHVDVIQIRVYYTESSDQTDFFIDF